MLENTGENPRTETGTRTFSKECVVVTDIGEEIAVAVMSVTVLRSFQKEHTEAILEKIAQTCRALYLEAGNALKEENQ